MALSILVGCDSDDAFKYEPYVRGIDPLWGYMNGMVTNMKTGEQYLIDHEQHPSLKSRQGHHSEFRYNQELNKQVQFRYMTFYFNDKEAKNHYERNGREKVLPSLSYINLTLIGDFKKGAVEIVDGENFVRLEDGAIIRNLKSSISIEIYDDADKSGQWGVKPLRYIPREDHPFYVYLDTVEFDKDNLDAPLLEGYLSGTLYREDNPEERMIVDMKFGM